MSGCLFNSSEKHSVTYLHVEYEWSTYLPTPYSLRRVCDLQRNQTCSQRGLDKGYSCRVSI